MNNEARIGQIATDHGAGANPSAQTANSRPVDNVQKETPGSAMRTVRWQIVDQDQPKDDQEGPVNRNPRPP